MSNSLDPDQDRHGPDLVPNCLQRLSANNKSPPARKELTKGALVIRRIFSLVDMITIP